MYYLQLAIVALFAVFLCFNIKIALVLLSLLLILLIKNNNFKAKKITIFVVVFLAFFIRSIYVNCTNVTKLENGEYRNYKIEVVNKVDINGNFLKINFLVVV